MTDPNAPTRAEMRQHLSGLDFVRQMMTGTLPPPPMVQLLGMRLVHVEEGFVAFAAVPAEAFYNGLGVAHGGFAATMLDSALGCSINTMLPAGRVMTTLELKINYTRPLRREV